MILKFVDKFVLIMLLVIASVCFLLWGIDSEGAITQQNNVLILKSCTGEAFTSTDHKNWEPFKDMIGKRFENTRFIMQEPGSICIFELNGELITLSEEGLMGLDMHGNLKVYWGMFGRKT